MGVGEERVKAAGLAEDGDAEPVCAAGRASRSHRLAGRLILSLCCRVGL